MRLRSFLVAAALLAIPSTALAQDVVPLTGTGENIAPIARVKVPGANEVAVAGDWAFVSTDAVEEKCGCLYIVNIKDPAHPFIEGTWDSTSVPDLGKQSYGDVDISPDANLAVLTNAHASENDKSWDVIIDTHDKAHPKLLSHIGNDGTMDYVHTSTLDNHLLYMNPQVFAGFPQPGHANITVVDIADPSNPKIIGKISGPGSDVGLAHDSYVDHRPDGKTLLYAASVHRSDVFDVTKPTQATWLQTQTSPDYTISHDVQPNFDRSMILVDDEGAAGGQLDSHVSACGKAGTGPATADSGSLHFYAAAKDGTFANNGVTQLGTFNAPPTVNQAECVAHVFWQAPDQNRLTQAYYNIGAWVIDFSDPANAKALGHFRGEGAMYWSNKAHNGYMYASNMNGSLDILRYTGEGEKAWPSTAGPAEIQLSQRQGVPYVPITGASSSGPPAPGTGPGSTPVAKTFGRFKFKIKGRKVPGKRGKKAKLTLTFKNAAGKRAARVKIKRKAHRRAKVKVSGVAASGRYTWVLKARKRRLARGHFTVGVVKNLQASRAFVARVR
jgi:hypothetical protein